MAEDTIRNSEVVDIDTSAYMDRLFCSTKERVIYVVNSFVSSLSMGNYDVGSDLYLYQLLGIKPKALAKAQIGLGIYDMVNDPVTAAIVDNMRSRWGKFKPFQYLGMIPNIIVGFLNIMLPVIQSIFSLNSSQTLIFYMVLSYASETIGALLGGGAGYINNVFTPNPNERTSLLVASKFVRDICGKLPEQIIALVLDIFHNGMIDKKFAKSFVFVKTIFWSAATITGVLWIIVSRERVLQSEKAPNPVHGILAVFKNRPMLVYTLSELVDGINIGSSQSLYYSNVVHFNLMTTIAGIPGSPISYASYPISTKFRERMSTKALWICCRSSILISETMFFLFGCIGGEKKGMYLRKVPMTIVFGLGNCLEMVFYASKKIIGDEINFEVLDYCEWKNGFRVEATIDLIKNYLNKARNIVLRYINAWLLEEWAGFEAGMGIEQSDTAKWRIFLTAFGPSLIFDAISILPMFLYNIDHKTREKMYIDLEVMRSAKANAQMLSEINDTNNTQ